MFKNITYKQRVILLIIGLIVLMLLINRLAINRTIGLKNQSKELTEKLDEAKDAPLAIISIKKRLAFIDEIVGRNLLDADDIQVLILEKCIDYSAKNNLVLRNLPQPHKFSDQNFDVQTCIVELEGGFTDLLKLVYLFEQKYSLGKIISVSFVKEEDRFNKIDRLKLTIYIQNIKSLNNEKQL